MHLKIGAAISGLLLGAPLAFQVNVPQPPVNLNGWIAFAMLASGFLTMLSVLVTKLVINPAVQTAIKAALSDIPTRTEFEAHVEKDEDFQNRVDGYIERHEQGAGEEHRHRARRRGDPQ